MLKYLSTAQVITASVKGFADCFSSPHGHHSRKPITFGGALHRSLRLASILCCFPKKPDNFFVWMLQFFSLSINKTTNLCCAYCYQYNSEIFSN